jgi:hypothetical protein
MDKFGYGYKYARESYNNFKLYNIMAWNVSELKEIDSVVFTTGIPTGSYVCNDGELLYLTTSGGSTGRIYYADLSSSPYNVNGVSFSSITLPKGVFESRSYSLDFSQDGGYAYILGTDEVLYQLEVGTPFDLSSVDSSGLLAYLDLSAYGARQVQISPQGEFLFVRDGNSVVTVFECYLGNYDISDVMWLGDWTVYDSMSNPIVDSFFFGKTKHLQAYGGGVFMHGYYFSGSEGLLYKENIVPGDDFPSGSQFISSDTVFNNLSTTMDSIFITANGKHLYVTSHGSTTATRRIHHYEMKSPRPVMSIV